jgi:hypothetical protein
MENFDTSEVTDWRGLMQEATKDGEQAKGTVTNTSASSSAKAKQDPAK